MKRIMKLLPVFCIVCMCVSVSAEEKTLRIMPVGDSITRGTYMSGNRIAGPSGGGWRKFLQDKLRAADEKYTFVGELDYWAYGKDGVVDQQFSPRHHGLAGFSNTAILKGGVVPTPKDVLKAKGVKEIRVPGIVEAIERNKPDVILLMSGANGFNAKERDKLVKTVCANFKGKLYVANITPQKEPRNGWKRVTKYNESLPALVKALKAEGNDIRFVDMFSALTDEDITKDGVHPNTSGLKKIATCWFEAMNVQLK